MKSKSIKVALFDKPVFVSICIIKNINPVRNIKLIIPTLNCALINPSLICSYDQLTSAITRAICNYLSKSMRTRSPYTELLYALSPSTNVTESLMTFGINETSKCAIAVRFTEIDSESPSSSSLEEDLTAALNCDISDFSMDALVEQHDPISIKEVYKPSSDQIIGEICTQIATKSI